MKRKKDLIFGIHSVSEAARSGKTIDKVLVRKGLSSPVINDLLKSLNLPIPLFNMSLKKN
jgi:tRNA G18 (ribose-2'-O)-methylase SpoU